MVKYKLFEKLLEKVQTIFEKDNKEDSFKYKNSLFDTTLDIKICGLKVERSYEDRSVYFNLKFNSNKSDEKDLEFTTWINGEKAIELGQLLISHGIYSLESNMINHQKIHHYNQLKQFLNDEIVDKTILKMIKDLDNGNYLFNIKPIWKKNKKPKYQEDFNFDDIIYISPFEKEFKEQMESFGGIDNIKFVNYSWEKTVQKFNEFSKKFDN